MDNEITLERLKSEKEILENEIDKLISGFYQKYGVFINGNFNIEEERIGNNITNTTINVNIDISL